MNKIHLVSDLKFLIILVFLLTFSATVAQIKGFKEIKIKNPVCELHPDLEIFNKSKINNLRKRVNLENTPCSNFVVTYDGFTDEARIAFQHAIDIWAHILESPVDILVSAEYKVLESRTLGSARPASFNAADDEDETGVNPNIWYPAALFEKLIGKDRDEFGGRTRDIVTNFNSEINWYFGLDANPPDGQFDFVTVVLHELGHGLGFTGFGRVEEPDGLIRQQEIPSIYDTFIENSDNVSILTLPDPSPELFAALTGNDLFANSPTAIIENSNIMPRINALSTFSQGSSYSHWNEATFPQDNPNSLMTPSVGAGVANHNPGNITLGFFKDMGWSICTTLSIEEVENLPTVSIRSNLFKDEISLVFNNINESSFQLKIFDIKGIEVYSKELRYDGSNIIDIKNLDNLPNGLYFLRVLGKSSNLRLTEKILKI